MDNPNNMSVKIKTIAKVLPEFSRTTEKIVPFIDIWLHGQEDRFVRKVRKIFEGAMVDKRYSFMSPEEVFSNLSFEERNNIYKREGIRLGTECVALALQKAGWAATDLDFIITVSCTGIMIPSVDAYLINNLGMRKDIVRLPVTEMGCAAGISGMIYAKNFLKANPGKRAAVLAVESPTATFQFNDLSMANVVSAAIFGDGVACALLSSHESDAGPELVDEEMYHFYHSEQMMGFDLCNSGLKMVLDVAVPDTIAEHFPSIIHPFLHRNGLEIKDVDHLIFHPGGKKIIQVVDALFGALGKNIDDTKEVLRLYGNMSSATVLYVLERILDAEPETDQKLAVRGGMEHSEVEHSEAGLQRSKARPKSGDIGLMLSFGPGFSAQKILLKW